MKPSSSKKPSRSLLADRAHIAAIILIVLTTLIVYSQTLGHGFIIGYDDADYVTRNPRVQAGPTLDSIKWAFTAFHSSNWHPLTWISHMLDCRLFDLKAGGHHATNLILHLANALLLYYVLRRMTKFIWRSAFVAILFAVHPLHVESVAWISERKDLLSGLFAMLTILAYIRYAERPEFRRYALVVLALAAGLMSKPMLVTMPFVLLLLDYWPLGRLAKRGLVGLVVEKLPLLALSVASCAITVVAQRSGGSVRSLEEASLAFRIPAAAISYVTYIVKMIWPRHLAIPYLYSSNVLPIWKVIASVIVLAAITSLVVLLRRKRPYLLVGWLWYVGTLVPVIGFVQVGPQMIADRYTYLPIIGLFVMVSWAVPELGRRLRKNGRVGEWASGRTGLVPVLAGVVVIALMISASFQAARWRNTFTLFEYVLSVTGENRIAHNALGMAYEEEGKLDEAVARYSKAASLDPRFAQAYYNLGTALMAQGRLDDAATALSRALAINPGFADAYTNLGAAFARMNKMDEAVAAFRKAIGLKPDDELARRNLDAALEDQATVDSAIAGFNRILASDPRNARAHCQLGNILAGRRDFEEAIRHFREAVRSDPEFVEARRNLAMALFYAGRYSESWREVGLCGTHGVSLDPDFIRMLTDKMPEPAR